MASLFHRAPGPCRLLDAGAGVGALSCAFLDRWVTGGFGFSSVEATALRDRREAARPPCPALGRTQPRDARIIAGDYIELATAEGLLDRGYTHAILNPPYKKINSQSDHRLACALSASRR